MNAVVERVPYGTETNYIRAEKEYAQSVTVAMRDKCGTNERFKHYGRHVSFAISALLMGNLRLGPEIRLPKGFVRDEQEAELVHAMLNDVLLPRTYDFCKLHEGQSRLPPHFVSDNHVLYVLMCVHRTMMDLWGIGDTRAGRACIDIVKIRFSVAPQRVHWDYEAYRHQ